MENYVLPGVTLLVFLVSLWLMLRDIDEHGLGEKTDAKADEDSSAEQADAKADENPAAEPAEAKVDEASLETKADAKADETSPEASADAKTDENPAAEPADIKASETSLAEKTDAKAEENPIAESADAVKRAKRLALIYSAVMLLVTEGAAVMFLTVYTDVRVLTALKRLALLAVIWPTALIDLKTYRIPNAFILWGLICRVLILFAEFITSEPGVWQTLLTEGIAAGAMLLAAFFCSLIIKNSIGFGDMKLFLVMGLLLGTDAIWGAVFLSLLVSFVIAAYVLITKRKTRKDVIPFGPALVIGTFLSVYLTGM